MKYTGFCLLVILSIIVLRANGGVSPFDILKSNLSPEIASAYLNNFNISDVKNMLKKKCDKVLQSSQDVDEIYNRIESASTQFTECISSLFNITSIQEEIETAKPIGELDTVFVKHCSKRQQVEQCVVDFNGNITQCLDKEEKAGNAIMMKVVHSMFDFVCYKGGDQIALFYAEKGPECLEENKIEIGHCLNTTLKGLPPSEGIPDMNSITIPQLVMGPKQCTDMYELEKCIVKHLETCDEITPSNIVESMFKFINKESQCSNQTTKSFDKKSRNISSSMHKVSFIFFTIAFAQFLSYML